MASELFDQGKLGSASSIENRPAAFGATSVEINPTLLESEGLEVVSRSLKLPMNGIILDLGTDWGRTAIQTIQFLESKFEGEFKPKKIIAADISPGITGENPLGLARFPDEAEKYIPQWKSRILTAIADLQQSWNFVDDKSVDLITAGWMAHWCGQDHQRFFQELGRAATDDCVVHIKTLSPFDVAICGLLFSGKEQEEIVARYPNAIISKEEHKTFGEVIRVNRSPEAAKAIAEGAGYFIYERPEDTLINPGSSGIGYTPKYLIELLKQDGFDVLYSEQGKNVTWQNPLWINDSEKSLTHLHIVGRKS